MKDPNQPEPAPTGNGIPITPLVIEDLKRRSEAGEKKYGTVLRAHNGRDCLVDAYQEALDLCQYLRQRIEEKSMEVEEVKGLIQDAVSYETRFIHKEDIIGFNQWCERLAEKIVRHTVWSVNE